MKSLEAHIAKYNEYHTTKFTKATHAIGIPFLGVAVLMFLNWFSIDFATNWQISFSWFYLLISLTYYFCLNSKISLVAIIILIPITYLATVLANPVPNAISILIFLALLIFGASLIYIGHHHEKKRAHCPISLYHFQIAPLLLIIDLLKVLHLKKYFIEE